MPEQGDIVLIPVPFTDLSTHKRHPVVNAETIDRIRTMLRDLISKKS